MISDTSTLTVDSNEEIPALIETLLATEQRLEELTSGEVDSVAGLDGRTFLLRRAQEQLRHIEADKQAAILNALPAHIALLDTEGNIISVNEAWRRFAVANVLCAPEHGVGLNYLTICDRARGAYSSEAHQVADGIRSVLDGEQKSFSIEYPCHSPTEKRWFLLTVTPLASDAPNGAVVMHLNITESKSAAAALEELSQKTDRRERMLTTMLANLHDFAYIYDRTGRFLFANQPLLDLWGLTLDAVVGKNFYELGYPDELARRLQQQLQDVFETGKSITGETPYVSPAGAQGFYEYIFSPAFAGNGTVEFVVGSTRDITERKLAETALRESEAEFRALAEAMPQMVWITRPDGWNIYFSQQWMDYTGLTLEESFGHGWIKPFHPEDQQHAWDAWQRATATIGVYSIESRLRRADGAYRWWLIRGVPQLDATGHIIKWFGTCTDIHELKLAELEISRANQALRDSDEKFRAMADNITDVFWITSPDFNTIHYVSAGYELIWGCPAESLYANPQQWVEAILPDERESAFAVFATLMGTASEANVEYRIARPDGTVRWIHDRGYQVRDALGKLVRLTGIASDITERKQLEAQLTQAQKLEAIGTLAGGIAHDFNNILAAIMGYSQMAQRGINQDSRAQAHLEQVLIASTRAKDLVKQILTFSRSEEPDREPLELQPIIDETLMLLQVSLPSTVEIRQNIDLTAPPLLGDATQLRQVILNLCVNAAQAMKEHGGILGIRLSCLEIDCDFAGIHPELKEGPHVRLDVSDTGRGMDRAMQERIFEPFFTTKAPGEGTGLGLAVVHGVIKNHGGAIAVLSEPGVGTTFSIYLPVYERLQAAIIHESDSMPRGNGEHILFVDDEEALVSLGKSMLEVLGYRVTTWTDSSEALAAFRSQPQDFDLVITDQTMPHLNGGDLATALLGIRPTLPIILLTGYNATMSFEQAKAIGIRELLFKPNTMQALGEAVRRALDQSGKG